MKLPVGGPKDERMSWGLHFYESDDLIKNEKLVPEIHGSDHLGKEESFDPLSDEDERDKDVTKSVVDWNFHPPKDLRKPGNKAKAVKEDAQILESGNESS